MTKRKDFTKGPIIAYEVMRDERLSVLDKLVFCHIQTTINSKNKIHRNDHRINSSTIKVSTRKIAEHLMVKWSEVKVSLDNLTGVGYTRERKEEVDLEEVIVSGYSYRHKELRDERKAEDERVALLPLSDEAIKHLAGMYINEIKVYLAEIDRPSSVIANYMIGIARSNVGHYRELVEEQIHNYAWDLSPWLKDVRPYKLFMVFDYYKMYAGLSDEERKRLKAALREVV